MIQRPVDDLELCDGQRPKKCQDHLIFVITVEWISLVMHRVQKRGPKKQLTRNALVSKFEKLQSSFTTDLYYH